MVIEINYNEGKEKQLFSDVRDVVYIRPFQINLIFKSGKIKTLKFTDKDKIQLHFVR